jgi:hypothetical protein
VNQDQYVSCTVGRFRSIQTTWAPWSLNGSRVVLCHPERVEMNIWGFNTPNLPTQLGGAPDPAAGIPLFSTPSPLLEDVARLRPASGGGFGRRGLDLPHVAASRVLGGYGYRASGSSFATQEKVRRVYNFWLFSHRLYISYFRPGLKMFSSGLFTRSHSLYM